MDKVKFDKLKVGDVMKDERYRYLVTKIELENGQILAFNDRFRDIVMSHDYAEKYCYYVESLDMIKVVSFLKGHKWWMEDANDKAK
jgi:hypothetical protein